VTEGAPSLLATKLFVPPARPGLVSRPRLMERMRSALDYGFVLISGSAGSGKSTLASDWIRQIRESTPAGWVSLDSGATTGSDELERERYPPILRMPVC